jgi:hypothetical protein
MGKKRNKYRIMGGKPEDTTPLERTRRGLENGVKMNP